MATVVSRPASTFKVMPEGTHAATLSAVVDKGMQPIASQYVEANRQAAIKEGRDPSTVKTEVHKIVLEYTNEEGEKASEWFTLSLASRAALLPRVTTLLGSAPPDNFDLDTLIGTPVTLLIESGKNAKGYDTAKIVGLTRRKASGVASRASVTTKAPVTAPAGDNLGITDDDIPF